MVLPTSTPGMRAYKNWVSLDVCCKQIAPSDRTCCCRDCSPTGETVTAVIVRMVVKSYSVKLSRKTRLNFIEYFSFPPFKYFSTHRDTNSRLFSCVDLRLKVKQRVHPTPKLDETGSFQCLGHSSWTICIPLNPLCSGNFPSFSVSYWEAISYYPRGPIMEKGKSSNPKTE